ncbi:hypothetical protein L6164_009950 [Bauhinia variegata]|uniref:Uncharacterized protein n=1 Tax=Bauhinia variegata TaxID=167791 RepID=A0ACB9PMV1_BAUVA|nr:hypothetical protein L6164_009950 [Bauhinia variegata]
MGCFLGCFGSSKDAKRRKQRRKVLPRDQQKAVPSPASEIQVQPSASSVRDYSETLPSPASEIQNKLEEQLRLSPRKKVTFDSNVKTYEPVLLDEVTDFPPEKSEGGKEDESFAKPSQSKSSSEDSSVTSTGSYPSNHRYQNCRDSDDEEEELDYGDSDLSDEDDEDDYSDMEEELNEFGEEIEDGSRTRTTAAAKVFADEESPIPNSNREVKSAASNLNARDRSTYVHPVLNPVENLSQWKAIKAKRTQPLRPQKENYNSNQESQIPFSAEPSFKERSFSSKPESNQSKKLNHEIAVDASLSNWLGSSENTPVNKTSLLASHGGTPDKSPIHGSNSVISHEDRPILGALTVEEIKQFSASSSPRKSPCRSPDEMPIIGTVGTYWNHSGSVKDSGSASSFKGIPNTTSKYREDKRVNWHSTPFETRLERALNTGAAETTSIPVPRVF